MMDALDGLVPTPILNTKDLSKVKENHEAEVGASKRSHCIDQLLFPGLCDVHAGYNRGALHLDLP
jgi:hypothetical protein